MADRRPHTFPEASGVHFGTNFGFKNDHVCHFFGGPVGAFLTPVFRRFFAIEALCKFIASAFVRKSRIRLATHKNQWVFTYVLFSRRRKARSKARNRGQQWYRKWHPKCNKKQSFLSIFHLSGCNSHKTSKNDLPEPPRAPRKRTQNRPKSRQELPKMDPGRSKNTFLALSKKIRATISRSDRPPEPHLPPKTPREASRGHKPRI